VHNQQLHGHNFHAKNTELARLTFGKHLLLWEHANVHPLNLTFIYSQAIRVMLLSGSYCLSWRWAASDFNMGVPAHAIAAMMGLHFNLRMTCHDKGTRPSFFAKASLTL
jgi:hypothetical protein